MVAIFVVLTIVAFLMVDIIYQKIQKKKAFAAMPKESRAYPRPLSITETMLPGGIFFHPSHTWARILRSGKVKIGIDDLVQKLVGKIDAIEVHNGNKLFKQGEPLITIRQGNRTLTMVAPVDGMVERFNTDIAKDPSLMKINPYSDGWIVMMNPVNLNKSLGLLKIADAAKDWFMDEVNKLRDFLAGVSVEDKLVGQTLQDGGTPVEGVLEFMDDESWNHFEKKFLIN